MGMGVAISWRQGTYFQPELYENPTIDGRNQALINRAGVYDGESVPRLSII